jgi:hypoxanthine phosphoribosyltransferase
MRAIPGPCSYGYIDVVRDVSDTEIATALEIDFLSHNNALQGRRVYVLKDVVMTGVIENYLLTQLRQRAPRTLKLVALLDRPEGRRVDLSVDFRAFTVKEGSYVGYGLDLDEGYSNLPYIGRL